MLELKLRNQEKIVITVEDDATKEKKIEAVIEIVGDRKGNYRAVIQNSQKVHFHTKSHLMKNMIGKTITEIVEG